MKLKKLIISLCSKKNEERRYEILKNICNIATNNPDLLNKLDIEVVSKLLQEVLFCHYLLSATILELVMEHVDNMKLQIALLQGNAELVATLLKNGEKADGQD